ncbi:hypothetical protein [uncultured Paraglaciecola sp.]|uniref:hypothetical protein n=1 Tax=uncultured Paraglaciecola sp. TaxID=1765024 RepID=UPI0026346CA5|nr:hypothetical protein [uncultured Paraglaciecola sp.]
MKTYSHELIRQDTLDTIQCDVCNRVEHSDKADSFISAGADGSRGCVIGSGQRIEIDMCPDCFINRLGEYARVVPF